jgi:hypothetical protein
VFRCSGFLCDDRPHTCCLQGFAERKVLLLGAVLHPLFFTPMTARPVYTTSCDMSAVCCLQGFAERKVLLLGAVLSAVRAIHTAAAKQERVKLHSACRQVGISNSSRKTATGFVHVARTVAAVRSVAQQQQSRSE